MLPPVDCMWYLDLCVKAMDFYFFTCKKVACFTKIYYSDLSLKFSFTTMKTYGYWSRCCDFCQQCVVQHEQSLQKVLTRAQIGFSQNEYENVTFFRAL